MGIRGGSYVVLDFETTGLSPRRAEVIEFGAVRWEAGRLGDSFAALCRPTRPVSPAAEAIHGITETMLADAEPFARHLPDLVRFLGDRTIVAHHARFDVAFLRAALLRAGHAPRPNPVLCTVLLSRRLFPEIKHHDLESLCRYHGIPRRARHRALADAEATAWLLDVLVERAESEGITDPVELLRRGTPRAGAGVEPVRLTEPEWRLLEEAILTGDRVTLRYVSRRGVSSERDVVPYVVSRSSSAARLVAYDLDAGVTRTFRLDRVRGIGAEP